MENNFFEVVASMIAISGITTGVTMMYINLLHKHTNEKIDMKFNAGKQEHERLDRRIDKIDIQ